MLKKIIIASSIIFSVSTSNASDGTLYKTDPKSYFANHPAATPGENGLECLDSNTLVHVSSFLDFASAKNLLSVNKKFHENKLFILAAQVPKFYKTIGLDYNDVFIQLSHPQWTPANLGAEMKVKLHFGWYHAARKISLTERSTSEEILHKFKLLYQASCLGHMPAIIEAGKMLLNPDYNETIPACMSYEVLDPDVKKWDIQRLSRPMSTDTELMSVFDAWNESLPDIDTDDEIDPDTQQASITQLKSCIARLKKLDQTVEVKAFGIMLGETIANLSATRPSLDFFAKKTVAYIKHAGASTPFLRYLVLCFEDEDEQFSKEAQVMIQDNFQSVLNELFVSDYAQLLHASIFRSVNGADTPIISEKAFLAIAEYNKLSVLSALLGGKVEYISSMISVDPGYSQAHKNAVSRDKDIDQPIVCMLSSLALMKNPTLKKYRQIRDDVFYIYVGASGENENEARLEMMDKYFGYESDEENASDE